MVEQTPDSIPGVGPDDSPDQTDPTISTDETGVEDVNTDPTQPVDPATDPGVVEAPDSTPSV